MTAVARLSSSANPAFDSSSHSVFHLDLNELTQLAMQPHPYRLTNPVTEGGGGSLTPFTSTPAPLGRGPSPPSNSGRISSQQPPWTPPQPRALSQHGMAQERSLPSLSQPRRPESIIPPLDTTASGFSRYYTAFWVKNAKTDACSGNRMALHLSDVLLIRFMCPHHIRNRALEVRRRT